LIYCYLSRNNMGYGLIAPFVDFAVSLLGVV